MPTTTVALKEPWPVAQWTSHGCGACVAICRGRADTARAELGGGVWPDVGGQWKARTVQAESIGMDALIDSARKSGRPSARALPHCRGGATNLRPPVLLKGSEALVNATIPLRSRRDPPRAASTFVSMRATPPDRLEYSLDLGARVDVNSTGQLRGRTVHDVQMTVAVNRLGD
jgi:hypothetical protein